MDPAIWYLGTPGDLRPIVCPERDVVINPVRYGGIHQGLSGARTMDVTGVRYNYEFQLNWLEQPEYAWLQAMYFRVVNGPHRMINPLNPNRLSPEGSGCNVASGTARGITFTSGLGTRVWDWPSAAGVGAQSTKWTNRPAGFPVARWDFDRKTTMVPNESVTGSIWMKSSVALAGTMVFDWYDRLTSLGGSATQAVNLTTAWQRFSITRTVPSNANLANLAFYTNVTAPDIYLAAAQVESGTSATPWVIGGGAPEILIDQLEQVSPRFPLMNIKATILEA